MGALLAAVAVAVGAFVATNVDDLLVLTTLFAAAGERGPRRRDVVVGQYLGIFALCGVSALAALGLFVVPQRWVGLMGLIPVALGVRGLVTAHRQRRQVGDAGAHCPNTAAGLAVHGLPGVVAVTVANGADNISIYTPLFRQAGGGQVVVYALVFAMLVGVWCAVAWLAASRTAVNAIVAHGGRWLVPTVFICVGVVILAGSAAGVRIQ